MKDIFQVFFSNSSKMNKIKQIIDKIEENDITVLIKGESGTGKELVAHSLHLNSRRREKPFIKVNCSAIPKGLLESELFGFEKGAFTGAYQKKPGKFELANGGTILLNDVGEMDISIQAKLLQVLQNNEFSRLGGELDIKVDTRVITTSQDHLEKSVFDGRFREDLFYRINVMSITVPPLRERREQIPHLAEYFFDIYRKKYGKSSLHLSSATLSAFQRYHWPGNMRELENVMKRIILFNDEESVVQSLGHGYFEGEGNPSVSERSLRNHREGIEIFNLKQVGKAAAASAEKEAICKTLLETHWNRKKAAKRLRVSYKALLYKIQKYHLDESEGFEELVGGGDENFRA